MAYPEKCIKGIPNKDCIRRLGPRFGATVNLFQFQDSRARPDGWIEESINWMDDAEVVPFTLAQTKDGGLHFKIGVAVLERIDLDTLRRRWRDIFEYERLPLEGNGYHGNLLVHSSSGHGGMPFKRMISNALVAFSEVQIRPDAPLME